MSKISYQENNAILPFYFSNGQTNGFNANLLLSFFALICFYRHDNLIQLIKTDLLFLPTELKTINTQNIQTEILEECEKIYKLQVEDNIIFNIKNI